MTAELLAFGLSGGAISAASVAVFARRFMSLSVRGSVSYGLLTGGVGLGLSGLLVAVGLATGEYEAALWVAPVFVVVGALMLVTGVRITSRTSKSLDEIEREATNELKSALAEELDADEEIFDDVPPPSEQRDP